jgi:integrase
LGLCFVMATACRRAEVLGATWDEIDLDARIWTIPAKRMKSGRMHRVPLSDQAVLLLQVLASLRHSEHVFPGTNGGRPVSATTMLDLMRGLHQSATIHGMRSSFRDWCTEHGVAHEIAEMALAHRIGDATVHAYLRGDALEPRRMVMQQWGDFLTGAPTSRSQEVDAGHLAPSGSAWQSVAARGK